jgi:hypothetical protein
MIRPAARSILLFCAFVQNSNAECNDPTEWSKFPGNDVTVVVGHRQEFPGGLGDPYVSSGDPISPFPPLFSDQTLKQLGGGKLSTRETSYISYYEKDRSGGWRICRLESWWPPSAGNEQTRAELLSVTTEYTSKKSTFAKLTAGHMALYATLYFYDSVGRLSRIEEGDFSKKTERALIKICRRYDQKDRLLLFLNPRTTQSCAADVPDVRDEWIRYKYGEVNGKQVPIWDEWHHGDGSGRWSKRFEQFRTGFGTDDIHGAASAKSHKGVTTIYGSTAGKLDDNSANTVLNEFAQRTGSTYQFTKPRVPLEVLENPMALYKYERRRQTYIDGQLIRMYELFKPNEHISHHRYYYAGGMWRNEQVDANGKVTRVITIDDYRQPRPGPHPGVDDKLLTDKGLRIFGHQIYHRVYDINAKGQPVLMAVSWNRKLRLNPFKGTNIDFADVAYGTPDGKVRWKKLADFEKQFGFTSNAAEVFPDRKGLDEDDDDD